MAWSNEFQLFQADGIFSVWSRFHEAMNSSCQQGTVEAGGDSIMVSGILTWLELDALVCLNMLLTGNYCVVIVLCDHLYLHMV